MAMASRASPSTRYTSCSTHRELMWTQYALRAKIIVFVGSRLGALPKVADPTDR